MIFLFGFSNVSIKCNNLITGGTTSNNKYLQRIMAMISKRGLPDIKLVYGQKEKDL
jgi:hypothetical protein